MLDVDRILSETFVARVEWHPTIGSTNDLAARCAAEAGDLPLLVVAERQTAGRGRGSNHWWTGPGSLAFSLLVEGSKVHHTRGRSPLVALAAALAVVDTVRPLLPEHPPAIHWPNDVMAGGRKLAGILIEVLADRRHIVGIGLNINDALADAPAELQTKLATVSDLAGRTFDKTDVLVFLLKSLARQFSTLRRDPESIAACANKLCVQREQTLSVKLGGRTITGRCRGIADSGALMIETPDGPQSIFSGTILDDRS